MTHSQKKTAVAKRTGQQTKRPVAVPPDAHPKKNASDKEKLKSNERKWGAAVWKAGWTGLPNALVLNQRALGLSTVDMCIVLNLVSYWWIPENHPYPSKRRIAEAIGIDPKTVQRSMAALERRGYIEREPRKTAERGNDTNVYVLAGLVKKLEKHADDILGQKAERQRAKKRRTRQAVST